MIGITANCLSLIFSDDSFVTVSWTDLDRLQVHVEKQVVVVRLFHQQSPNNVPLPESNEVASFDSGGPAGTEWVIAGFKGLGNGQQLLVRQLSIAPEKILQTILRTVPSTPQPEQDLNVILSGLVSEARMGGLDTYSMYSFFESDWEAKRDAAFAREDLGPCA